MKVKIWNPTEKREETLCLKLENRDGKGIDLLMVDEEGHMGWFLMYFSIGPNGQLCYENIGGIRDERVATDEEGRILERGEIE